MIVANMNLHEVYADLTGETRKLDWKRDTLLNKAVGLLSRRDEFPASVTYDYKIPSSKNQYVIYFYREHASAPFLAGYLCVLFDDKKRYVIKWTDRGVPEILVLTSHFLQRYKERFLRRDDLSANEVAVRFLSRNRRLRPMAVDERISKRVSEYGEFAGEGFLSTDGFCFKLSGEETVAEGDPVRISLFTTFMPLDEMSEAQREAIMEECIRGVESLR